MAQNVIQIAHGLEQDLDKQLCNPASEDGVGDGHIARGAILCYAAEA
jgi:hypothetical protein